MHNSYTYICLLPYITNDLKWKSFTAFADRLVTTKLLYSELAIMPCAKGFDHTELPCTNECFSGNYNSVLQPYVQLYVHMYASNHFIYPHMHNSIHTQLTYM